MITESSPAITALRCQYAFLSNFYPLSPAITYEGLTGPTVEHLMQAAKTTDPADQQLVLTASSPTEAKRLGRKVKMRPDWNGVRVGVVTEIVRLKFAQPELARKLLATGHAHIYEGKTWGDTFWGVNATTLRGKNYLGLILMGIRDELRSAQ